MLIVMPKLLRSRCLHHLTLALAGFFDAPIVAKSLLELSHRRLLAPVFALPRFHLFPDAL